MLVAGEISGWRHARGVVLVQRGGKITHFAVRYAQKRLRAFNPKGIIISGGPDSVNDPDAIAVKTTDRKSVV